MAEPYAPSEANGWLLEGRECECGPEGRCLNHDTDAEAAYWLGKFNSETVVVTVAIEDFADAYEPGDPKRFDLDRIDA